MRPTKPGHYWVKADGEWTIVHVYAVAFSEGRLLDVTVFGNSMTWSPEEFEHDEDDPDRRVVWGPRVDDYTGGPA